jgi:hypothetical protein
LAARDGNFKEQRMQQRYFVSGSALTSASDFTSNFLATHLAGGVFGSGGPRAFQLAAKVTF